MAATGTLSSRAGPGLSWWLIVLLALLAAPRGVAHDLGLVGPVVNGLLVFVPLVCWVLVAVLARVPRPVLTLLIVGAIYGVLLGIGHQVFWEQAYGGSPPRLGGNLADLPVLAQSVIMRTFAFLSSLVTGAAVGVIAGVVAWALGGITGRRSRV